MQDLHMMMMQLVPRAKMIEASKCELQQEDCTRRAHLNDRLQGSAEKALCSLRFSRIQRATLSDGTG